MILSKDSNNNWTPTAGGTGTFIGTKAAFDAVKATLPDNTVAYITDDSTSTDIITQTKTDGSSPSISITPGTYIITVSARGTNTSATPGYTTIELKSERMCSLGWSGIVNPDANLAILYKATANETLTPAIYKLGCDLATAKISAYRIGD